MRIFSFPTGVYGANTYFIANEVTGECIIIDPGGSFDIIKEMAAKYRLAPKHVLLTHGHFDHIGALNEVRDYYKAEVYAHAECSRAIFDPLLNLSVYEGMHSGQQIKCEPAENILTDGQDIALCGLNIKAVHAPGHSKGCMVFATENLAFTGDVLFRLSIGRMDLLGGDADMMEQSLSKLKNILTPDMKILPGHGEDSVMSYELENNQYLMRL